jgi:hypothetical protein
MEDMNSDGTRHRWDMKTPKQQFPCPYDQDLSKILVGLNRRTPFARRRLANDPVTAAYLAAAVRLIQRHLNVPYPLSAAHCQCACRRRRIARQAVIHSASHEAAAA